MHGHTAADQNWGVPAWMQGQQGKAGIPEDSLLTCSGHIDGPGKPGEYMLARSPLLGVSVGAVLLACIKNMLRWEPVLRMAYLCLQQGLPWPEERVLLCREVGPEGAHPTAAANIFLPAS